MLKSEARLIIRMTREKLAKLLFLFLLSYALIYALQVVLPDCGERAFICTHKWGFTLDITMIDYQFYLLPVVGFFFSYLAISWINDFFETKYAASWPYPVVAVVFSLVAFWVQLFWLFCNFRTIDQPLGQADAIPFFYCNAAGAAKTNAFLAENFWKLFFDSSFFPFVLAMILGWAAHMVLEKLVVEEQPGKKKGKK